MDKIFLISHRRVVRAAGGRMIQAQRDRTSRKTGNGAKGSIENFTVCIEIFTVCIENFTVCFEIFTACIEIFTVCIEIFTICIEIFTVSIEILVLPRARGSRGGKEQIEMRAGSGMRTAKVLMSI